MSETTPATADELAAVYLRGRDVACPGCGYNRRDGATAACPECGAKLIFDFVHMGSARLRRSTVQWLTRLLLVVATSNLFMMIFSLARGIWLNGWDMVRRMPLHIWVRQGVYVSAQTFVCVLAIGLLVHLRACPRNEPVNTSRLIVGLVVIFGVTLGSHLQQMIIFLI